ncbi:hypothetical protein [Woodsholea maritima]|uniref:hypothetical protein n=1 Tax=Woodsholea maritima TaxID=240237 RepID=UPI000375A639|nr:hypothetical protein [Woodsholea maritima]
MTLSKVFVLSVFLVSALVGGAAIVTRVPKELFIIRYYADKDHQLLVGEVEYDCFAGFSSWGDYTRYSERLSFGSCDV